MSSSDSQASKIARWTSLLKGLFRRLGRDKMGEQLSGGRDPSLEMQRTQSVASSCVDSLKHKRGATGAVTAASVMQQLPQAISCPC